MKRFTANIFYTMLLAGVVCACSSSLDVEQAYEYNLTTLPIKKSISADETVEIRCQLNRTGYYKPAEYFIRYFQSSGKGILKDGHGNTFTPNDFVKLENDTFRLYYTSQCNDQQQLDFTIRDNFGQESTLSIDFTNNNSTTTK